jgi:outer membrane protein assembly factor BamE (lipoprotein component of BamABCDE complex)
MILISLVITSCQHNFHTGTNITNDQVKIIQDSPFTKSQISEKFGPPTIMPDYSPDMWYYIYRQSTKRAFFSHKIKEQRIVAMKFAGENLASVEIFDNQHNHDIQILSEYIKTVGTEKNPIQEYLGNIGRFHKHDKKKNQRR